MIVELLLAAILAVGSLLGVGHNGAGKGHYEHGQGKGLGHTDYQGKGAGHVKHGGCHCTWDCTCEPPCVPPCTGTGSGY